jgi:hypothetical protein
MNSLKFVIAGLMLAVLTVPVMAVENALGRTIPGIWVHPRMGVVPAGPNLNLTVIPLGYTGSIGRPQAPRLRALAGTLIDRVSADISENVLVPQYVFKTEHPKIGLASTLYLPITYRSATTSATTFSNAGLGDVFFSPLTVGIHFSENNHLAIDTKVWAPTGAFAVGDLAHLGMNAWTFTPNLAHTYMWKKRGLEVDNYVAFDIYLQNPTIQYTSGTTFHWDGMLFQYISERGGLGAIISNQTQINRDRGRLADRLDGFQGGAWGAGPMFMYVLKDPGVILQFRWIPEFQVTNLLKGHALLLSLTFRP